MNAFNDLVNIVRTLRSDEGCPWDRAQTYDSVRPYILEETYEVLDAIEHKDPSGISKELGDLLFQVLLLAQIAEDQGDFCIEDVIQQIADKMVSRHPHVFDPQHTPEEDEGGIAAWEARKQKERGDSTSVLDGVPKTLPALLRAHRMTEKASRVGFDWPNIDGVRAKIDEELAELEEALASGDQAAISDEYGDLLFTLVNLGRFLPAAPESSLHSATNRFERRFRYVETQLQEQNTPLFSAPLEELEVLWNQAKEAECSSS